MLKMTVCGSLVMDSEEILASRALSKPHRVYATNEQMEKDHIEALCLTFNETSRKQPIASK
jgi:hypothetical protein